MYTVNISFNPLKIGLFRLNQLRVDRGMLSLGKVGKFIYLQGRQLCQKKILSVVNMGGSTLKGK